MEVILQKTVPNLGLVGDLVNVKPGFYRNYLGPRNLALKANPKSIKEMAHQKKIIEAKKIKEKGLASQVKNKMEAQSFKVEHQAGAGEKLFGSVTNKDVVSVLKEAGFEIDRKSVLLDNPIKTVGDHKIAIRLHPEVEATITLVVTKKEAELVKVEAAEEGEKPAKKSSKKSAKKAEENAAPTENKEPA